MKLSEIELKTLYHEFDCKYYDRFSFDTLPTSFTYFNSRNLYSLFQQKAERALKINFLKWFLSEFQLKRNAQIFKQIKAKFILQNTQWNSLEIWCIHKIRKKVNFKIKILTKSHFSNEFRKLNFISSSRTFFPFPIYFNWIANKKMKLNDFKLKFVWIFFHYWFLFEFDFNYY